MKKSKSQKNESHYKTNKKNNILLWILGWLVIFPVPLTILLLRNSKLKKSIQITIVCLSWLFYIIIGLSLNSSNNDKKTTIHNENGVSRKKWAFRYSKIEKCGIMII